MSFCQAHPFACPIERCWSVLVLGEVFFPNEDYTVHIQNLQTGNYYREDITSDQDGYLALYKGEYEFMEGYCYEMYVTLKDECEPVDILTYGGEYTIIRFNINEGCYKKAESYYGVIERIKL